MVSWVNLFICGLIGWKLTIPNLRGDFLCFILAYDLTGESLANLILDKCEQVGLDISY